MASLLGIQQPLEELEVMHHADVHGLHVHLADGLDDGRRPLLVRPWVGLMPSESGIQARRPFGVALVSSPMGVLLEMERVPWLRVE